MAADSSERARVQALCWLLDEQLDAEDDLLALASRPAALEGWRRERLGEFCPRVGERLHWPGYRLAGALHRFRIGTSDH
jgi:hypothetical protein